MEQQYRLGKPLELIEGIIIERPGGRPFHNTPHLIIKGRYGDLEFVCNHSAEDSDDWYCADRLTDGQKTLIFSAIKEMDLSFCQKYDLTSVDKEKITTEANSLWNIFWEQHCLALK